jgi:type I restriction enzyme S subunit
VIAQMMKLGDVCHTFTGGTPSRTKPEYFGGGIPWVKITDLLQGVVIATGESVTSAGIANSSAKLLPVGTVLISIFATIGRTAVLGIEAATNQAIAGVVPHDTAQLDPQYLRYYLDSQHGYLNREARGVAQPNINQGILKNLDIPIPPLPEQHRIVDLLSRAEGIVRLRREAEKKAAELIPALFNDMFGDPATNPKGWPVALLGTVAQIQGGIQVTTKRDIYPLELPYLRVANVHRSRLELSEIKTIRLTPAEFTRIKLLRGDLLVVEGHGNPQEIGRVAIWDGSIVDCVHQNHLIRARCNPLALLPTFASAFLNSTSGRQFLLRSGKTTSGLTTISVSNVKAATILLPPVPLQTDFESKCESVRSVQSQQSTATAKAQATFDALLARCFAPTAATEGGSSD